MRTKGKRLLAGLASGALVLTGAAFVAAPQAQAAGEPVVYCAGSGGDPGVAGDPTSVSTDCVTVGGPGVSVPLRLSDLLPTSATGWVQLTLSSGTFAGTADTDDSTVAINATRTSGWFAGPDADEGPGGLAIAQDDSAITPPGIGSAAVNVLVGSVPQEITVTVATSSSDVYNEISTLNITERAPVAVTVVGAPGSLQIFPAYQNVRGLADDTAAVALVQVYDANGAPLPITAADVTLGQLGAAVDDITALPAHCGTSATGDDTFTADGKAAGLDSGALLVGTEACAALNATGTGVWIRSGLTAQSGGEKNVTVAVSIGGQAFTGSFSYTVSGTIAAGATSEFGSSTYNTGELSSLTWCLTDLAGNPVADGLGWRGGVTRPVQWASNATTAPLNYNLASFPVSTYGGCVTGLTFAPATAMVWNVFTTVLPGDGWTDAVQGATLLASTTVGTPEPVVGSIMIVGQRGTGADLNRVFVEGTTTNLVGNTVTPFFRLPGQVGFTAGSGVRTVDAQGNFNWQRKTGKRIAVQFRADDLRSNSIIIAAR